MSRPSTAALEKGKKFRLLDFTAGIFKAPLEPSRLSERLESTREQIATPRIRTRVGGFRS